MTDFNDLDNKFEGVIRMAAIASLKHKDMWDCYIKSTCFVCEDPQISRFLVISGKGLQDVKSCVDSFWEHDWLFTHPESGTYYVKLLASIIGTLNHYLTKMDVDYKLVEKIEDLAKRDKDNLIKIDDIAELRRLYSERKT